MYHGFHVASEFPGTSLSRRSYSVSLEEFASHMRAIERDRYLAPSTCWEPGQDPPRERCWALTFDDGLESALQAAEIVEAIGWRAHFFIISGSIGRPRFMTRGQVLDLHNRGHSIGSHSVSHPDPMSDLSYARLLKEWRRSTWALSDLLGEPVRIASVPGGSLSHDVVTAAAEAGVEVLFTSEPESRIHRVGGCTVIGRYAVQNGHSARTVAALVAGRPLACWSLWLGWNARKVAKKALGRGYYRLRARMLD
jgi:peptidoglycan/xylan/chitin deacetylase (PgdA/CDA1 family)